MASSAADLAATPVSTNGHAPSGEQVIEELRKKPRNVLLARGFGPLIAGVLLFILMLRLAPSVAPERVVERPVSTTVPVTAVPAP